MTFTHATKHNKTYEFIASYGRPKNYDAPLCHPYPCLWMWKDASNHQKLEGTRDFSGFGFREPVWRIRFVRLQRLAWLRMQNIIALSLPFGQWFLYKKQIRNMVGTLLKIGNDPDADRADRSVLEKKGPGSYSSTKWLMLSVMSNELILAISGNDIFSGEVFTQTLQLSPTSKQHGFVAWLVWPLWRNTVLKWFGGSDDLCAAASSSLKDVPFSVNSVFFAKCPEWQA